MGIRHDRGVIFTDDNCDIPPFLPSANITGHPCSMDYRAIPQCGYFPEAAGVGMTEVEAARGLVD